MVWFVVCNSRCNYSSKRRLVSSLQMGRMLLSSKRTFDRPHVWLRQLRRVDRSLTVGDKEKELLQKTFLETARGLRSRVTFTLPDCIWADQIHLVGDFNDWNPTSHPLHHHRDGSWSITIDLKPGQEYQFRYLVNGEQWVNDCRADDYVANSHGSHNSVVVTDTYVEYLFEEVLFEPKRRGVPSLDARITFDVSPAATKAGVREK